MLRMRHYLAFIAVLIGAVLFGSAALAVPDAWFRTGEAYRSAMPDAEVIARVDDVTITRGELRIARALVALNNEKSPRKLASEDRSIFSGLIEQKSLIVAAVRRGLLPARAETLAHIAQVREDFRVNAQAAANLREFLRGIGMTEAEYFESGFAQRRYAEVVAISRLREAVTGGLDPAAAESRWKQFESDTRASARIEIVDPTLR